jgi:serine/threonine-protein kinase RsbT
VALRQQVIPVGTESDVTRAVLAARDLANAAGLNAAQCGAIITAVSELARNIVKFAGHGRVELSIVERGADLGLQAVAVDQGPGIESLELAMRDNYSTSQTLGLGLPGTKRLVDDFEIESKLGHGTRVLVRKWA